MGWRSDLKFLTLFSAGNPAECGRDDTVRYSLQERQGEKCRARLSLCEVRPTLKWPYEHKVVPDRIKRARPQRDSGALAARELAHKARMHNAPQEQGRLV